MKSSNLLPDDVNHDLSFTHDLICELENCSGPSGQHTVSPESFIILTTSSFKVFEKVSADIFHFHTKLQLI